MFVAHTAVKINVPYGRAKLKDDTYSYYRTKVAGRRYFHFIFKYILAFIAPVV